MESIEFQDKKYPLRFVEITFDGIASVEPVSIFSLEEKLMNNDFDDWTSKEAERIDEQIFFYVQDEEINLPDYKLKKIIGDSLC